MPITQEQLTQLANKVATLTTDKAKADAQTRVSNDADAAQVNATATAAQAKLDEQTADALVTSDLADLRAFIDSLTP